MASSTYKSFLMVKKTSTYEKLIDIVSYPDLGGAPEMLDATSLSDPMTVNVLGIQSLDALDFEANYELEKYTELKAMEGKDQEFAVWLGGTESNGTVTPTGEDGKFEFGGQLSVYLNGGGVNEVRKMTISIAANTAIKLGASA